ncbi:MAG TPA: hypothetical protein VF940_25295, partial [Streptosporangiaceae bacterium]
ARSSSRAHGGTARRATPRSPTGRGKTAGRPPPCALALGVIMRLGSPPATPWWIIGTAGPPAAYLRLTLADSTTLKVPVTVVSGHRFFATRIGARIIRWGAFNAAGRELYGGSGPPDAIGKQHS